MFVVEAIRKSGSRGYVVRTPVCGYLTVIAPSFATQFLTYEEAVIVNMDAARKLDCTCKIIRI